jgi:hypothetical protein
LEIAFLGEEENISIMKRKALFLVLVIFLISILAGCEPHFLNGIEIEDSAEDFVYNYWIAIINRQYELAKGYCITNGVWYNKTDELEECINTNSEGEALVMIHFTYLYFTKKTEIVGDTAFVYVWVSIDKIPFFGSSGISGIGSDEYEMELIKETLFEGWMLK